jgi:hypothetical protein
MAIAIATFYFSFKNPPNKNRNPKKGGNKPDIYRYFTWYLIKKIPVNVSARVRIPEIQPANLSKV